MDEEQEPDGPLEIALVGDLTESEAELTDKLLAVEPGGECTLHIDSPGGSPSCAMSLTSLILLRGLQVTGIVSATFFRRHRGRSPLAVAAWSRRTACCCSIR